MYLRISLRKNSGYQAINDVRIVGVFWNALQMFGLIIFNLKVNFSLSTLITMFVRVTPATQ